MKSGKCNACDKRTSNLLVALCGHKACFQCVKINKQLTKCFECLNNLKSIKSRNMSEQKQKDNTKMKSQQMTRKKDHEQFLQDTTRKPSRTFFEKQKQTFHHTQSVFCRQHSQPFSMYCQSTKKVLCAVCLYKMGTFSNVLPIKSAEDILRKQNKIQKQESQLALNQVQRANKICKNNRLVFEKSFRSHMQLVDTTYRNIQAQLKKSQQKNKQILTNFFSLKLAECDQVCSDLDYLYKTLSDYRSSNQDAIPLNQSIFVYQSYRIIRKTLKNIDFNYFSYEGKQPKIINFSYPQLIERINKLITFKLDLPLKKTQSRVRSMSAREAERHTIEQENKNQRAKSRKDRLEGGLTGNLQQQFDESLYKKMLRIRFKQP